MDTLDYCLVCSAPVPPVEFVGNSWETVTCSVCGTYETTRELAEDGLGNNAVPAKSRYLVQAWIKQHTLTDSEPPRLSDSACANVIANAPRYTPIEKMERLLLAYSVLSESPGGSFIPVFRDDYPYAWARDEVECEQYVAWLVQRGLLTSVRGGTALSIEGWARAAELQKQVGHAGRTAFVAMWFDDSFDKVWTDGLRPGIQDAGYEPYRIKEDTPSERISFQTMAAIRASRFLVAEVTAPRPAVYYEAGFAEGLGKQIIWVCHENGLKHLSFDTRQFRYIVWKDYNELRESLKATIQVLLPQ
jgi:hypothetical protein